MANNASDTFKDLDKWIRNADNSLNTLVKNYSKLQDTISESKRKTINKAEREKLINDIDAMKTKLRTLSTELKGVMKNTSNPQKLAALAKAARDVTNALSAFNSVTATLNNSNKNTITLQERIARAFEKAAKALSGFRQEESKTDQETKRLNDRFSNIFGYLQKIGYALGVTFSLRGLTQFAKKLADVRGEYELQQVALRSIIQNKLVADEIWDKTMRAALQSPFTAMQLTKYTKQLAAYRIETDKLFDTTKRLADVSAGLGVDMQRLILAYGQVKAANYLRASEIRQFSEAGVNILGELSQYLTDTRDGMYSTAKVMDMVQKRMIKFEDVEAIFKRMTDQGGIFYNMQYIQSQTLKGQINKLTDAYQQMLNSMGKRNQGALMYIVKTLNEIVKDWRERIVLIKAIGFAGVTDLVVKFSASLGGLELAGIKAGKGLTKLSLSIKNLGKLMAANWRTAAVAGVVALFTAMIELDKRMRATNKEIDEFNASLFRERENFEQLKNRIVANNLTIDDSTSSTDDLSAAQKDNEKILQKLKNEYPQLAEKMEIATNGIVTMNGALDSNIRKLNEQMTLLAMGKQDGWFTDDFLKNMGEWESDLATVKTTLQAAQIQAEMEMVNLEQAGEKGSELYNILYEVSKLDLSGNIVDVAKEFDRLNSKIVESRNWRERLSAQLSGRPKKEAPLYILLGINPMDFSYPHDEPTAIKELLDPKRIAALKKSFKNGINDVKEYREKITGDTWNDLSNFVIQNMDKLNEDTKTGANMAASIFPKVLKPTTEEMRIWLNEMLNIEFGFINQQDLAQWKMELQQKQFLAATDGWTVALQSEIDNLKKKIGGYDFFAGASLDSENGETDEEKQSKIDAAWRRRINLLEEMKKRYDELAKSAYGYAKSEGTVRNAFEESFKEIFKGTGISMSQIDFTSMEGMMNSIQLALSKARGISDAVREEIMKKIDSYQARITIDAQVRIKDDFNRQLEDAFGDYELTLELDKLNLPKNVLSDMFDVKGTDLSELRKRLGELRKNLLDENGAMSEDAFKEYEKWLNKIDSEERKLQKQRMKDYAKYLEYELSERAKLEMDYVSKVAAVQAETAFDDDTRERILTNLKAEFDKKMSKQIWEDFKGSDMYVEMMEDLTRQGTDSLLMMRDKLEEIKDISEHLSPRALKEVVNAIQKIDETVYGRYTPMQAVGKLKGELDVALAENGLGSVFDAFERKKTADAEYAQAQERHKNIEQAIADYQKEKEILDQLGDSKEANVEDIREEIKNLRIARQTEDDYLKSLGPRTKGNAIEYDNALSHVNYYQRQIDRLENQALLLTELKEIQAKLAGSEYAGMSIQELSAMSKEELEKMGISEQEIQDMSRIINLYNLYNKKVQASYDELANYFSLIGNFSSSLQTMLNNLGVGTDEVSKQWSSFFKSFLTNASEVTNAFKELDAAKKAAQLAEPGNALADAAAGDYVKLAIRLASVLANLIGELTLLRGASIDKTIREQKERIDELTMAYGRLEKAIDRTLTVTSYLYDYDQMTENIRQQIDAVTMQLNAASSRKDVDESEIIGYQNTLNDLYDQLDELEQKKVEVFGGIGEDNYRSWAEGFVEAWKDAFLETGDGLDALQEHFDEFLEQWFVKQATMRIASSSLRDVMSQIDNAVSSDGRVNMAELNRIREQMSIILPNLNESLREFAGMFDLTGDGSLSGLAAGIQGITEEQANILEAYWNSVRMYTANIDVNVERIANMLGVGGPDTNPMLAELSRIAEKTSSIDALLASVRTNVGGSLNGPGIRVILANA